jgi:hypothetical protein
MLTLIDEYARLSEQLSVLSGDDGRSVSVHDRLGKRNALTQRREG